MRSELEHNRSAASEQDTGPAQALRRARLLERTDLPHSETAYEFQGNDHGAIGVSAIVVDAPPGSGPQLHKHPYTEVFVVLEGQVTFTAGEGMIEAGGGQIVVVPAGVPHTFSSTLVWDSAARWISIPAASSSRNGLTTDLSASATHPTAVPGAATALSGMEAGWRQSRDRLAGHLDAPTPS